MKAGNSEPVPVWVGYVVAFLVVVMVAVAACVMQDTGDHPKRTLESMKGPPTPDPGIYPAFDVRPTLPVCCRYADETAVVDRVERIGDTTVIYFRWPEGDSFGSITLPIEEPQEGDRLLISRVCRGTMTHRDESGEATE